MKIIFKRVISIVISISMSVTMLACVSVIKSTRVNADDMVELTPWNIYQVGTAPYIWGDYEDSRFNSIAFSEGTVIQGENLNAGTSENMDSGNLQTNIDLGYTQTNIIANGFKADIKSNGWQARWTNGVGVNWPWTLRASMQNVDMIEGHRYVVSFNAWASKQKYAMIYVRSNKENSAYLEETISIGKGESAYSFEFIYGSSFQDACIEVMLGAFPIEDDVVTEAEINWSGIVNIKDFNIVDKGYDSEYVQESTETESIESQTTFLFEDESETYNNGKDETGEYISEKESTSTSNEEAANVDLKLQEVLSTFTMLYRGQMQSVYGYFSRNEQVNDEVVYDYTRMEYGLYQDNSDRITMAYDEFINKVDNLWARHSDLKDYLIEKGEYDETKDMVSLKNGGGWGYPDYCEYIGYEKAGDVYQVYGKWMRWLGTERPEDAIEGVDYITTTYEDDNGVIYTSYWKQGDSIILELKDSVDGKYQIQAYRKKDDFNIDDTETTAIDSDTNVSINGWHSYFGYNEGWYEGADGGLTEAENDSWSAKLETLGWGGIWGARIYKQSELKVERGKKYTIKCDLKSTDCDKWIFVALKQGDDYAYGKWIKLDKGMEKSINETFIAQNDADYIYFGIGGECKDGGSMYEREIYSYLEGGAEFLNDEDPIISTQIECRNISLVPMEEVATTKPTEVIQTEKPTEKTTQSTTVKPTEKSTDKPKTTTAVSKPGKVSLSKPKNLKGKKVKLSWKKVKSVSGYQIMYATDKKFKKGKKTITVKASVVSKTIKKLKKKKTYYFRIRAYRTVGGNKKYGAWSNVKKVKIKK